MSIRPLPVLALEHGAHCHGLLRCHGAACINSCMGLAVFMLQIFCSLYQVCTGPCVVIEQPVWACILNFALQWGSPYMSVSMSPCVAMDQPVLVVVLRPCVAMYKKSVSAFIPDQARQCINAFFGPRVSTLARSGHDRIGSSNDDSSGREPHRYLFVTCYCHLNLGTLSYFTTCSTFATCSTFLAKWMSLSSFFVATRGLLLAFKGNIEILGRP